MDMDIRDISCEGGIVSGSRWRRRWWNLGFCYSSTSFA